MNVMQACPRLFDLNKSSMIADASMGLVLSEWFSNAMNIINVMNDIDRQNLTL
jgi:hypothetical protein